MDNKKLSKLTEKYLKETDENIVGVSYGYNMVNGKLTNEKVISFTVNKKLSEEELEPHKILPKTIEYDGEIFNTDVVQGKIQLTDVGFCYDDHYTWWEYWSGTQIIPTNRNEFRPIKGGISLTNYTARPGTVGTLGFLAIDKDTNSIVGVSNNHVLIKDAFYADERTGNEVTNIANNIATQPNESGNFGLSNSVGYVKRYVPISGINSNQVDGALITIDSGKVSLTESWKQEGLNLTSPPPFATTQEIDDLLTTDPLLYSAGRTTGGKGESDTKLKVTSVSSSININYNKQGVETLITFTDCIIYAASGTTIDPGDICFFPIAPGDSGSALLANIGGTIKIIGLSFAGAFTTIPLDPNDPNSEEVNASYYGIACRIDKVAEQLNIEAWDGSPVNYSDYSNALEYIVSGKSDQKTIEVGGKTYWQVGLTNSANVLA